MTWWRKYPGYAGTLLALGLLLAAEGASLARGWVIARETHRRLEQVSREFRALQAIRPAASAGNAAQIEADFGRVADALAAMRRELSAGGVKADRFKRTPVPLRRADAFFDIATFVETMRNRAQQAGVMLLPDERFGFSAFANEAPVAAQLAAVFRERLVVQCLLEALIEAKPRQLIAVQRQRPAESAPAPGRPNTNQAPSLPERLPTSVAKDYFDIDPRISLAIPGVVTTTAFRLSFTGHTAALRNLLNKLGESELPIVVRAVEVAPAELNSARLATSQTGPSPIVEPTWSRFVVTVEWVEIAASAASPS